MAARRFDAAALDAIGKPLLVGHLGNRPSAIVWSVRSGRLVRVASAPFAAVGAACEGGELVVVGREGQTLTIGEDEPRIGTMSGRRASSVLRGAAALAGGGLVAFGAKGQIHRRWDGRWQPWSIAPPVPGSGLGGAISMSTRTIVGGAGRSDQAWAFADDGAAWVWRGKMWSQAELAASRGWSCAPTRADGLPMAAGPRTLIVGVGTKWRRVDIGDIVPVAIAAIGDVPIVADATTLWRIEGRAPRRVLDEPIRSLTASKKGLLAVGTRDAFVSVDGARWARLV